MRAYAGCLLLVLGFRSWAGQAPTPAPQGVSAGMTVGMGFPGTAFAMRPMSGKPYSAKQVSEHNQTLADGTHITSPAQTVAMYRDSAGRTRTERPMGPWNLADQYMVVEIRDPVAQVQYTLDPVNKVAHRVVMQAPPQRPNVSGPGVAPSRSAVVAAQPPAPPSQPLVSLVQPGAAAVSFAPGGAPTGPVITNGPNGIQTQREDLGTQTMEGLVVRGTKITTTVPEGVQGNDRPLISVNENWFAPGLGLVVLSHNVDPRSGESTTKMTEISTNEPDPSLFAPPPDYSVVDETGPFQIKFFAQPKQ